MTLKEKRMYDIYILCREQIVNCVDCLDILKNECKNNRISGGRCQREGVKLLARVEQLQKRFALTPHELPSCLITQIAEMRVFWS